MGNFKKYQTRILLLCWCAYAGIYLGRYNLSLAIPAIQSFLGINKSQIGLLGGLFLWIYGTGQLINGYVGDKVSSRMYIFIGLLITAVANLAFGFASSLVIMCIIWAFNGFFQSMLWGPISKTLTHWVPPEKKNFTAVLISTSGVGGTLLTYLIAGQALDKLSWRWAFWIPAAIVLIYSFIWLTLAINRPEDIGLITPNSEILDVNNTKKSSANYTLWEAIKQTKLWFVIIACFAQAIVKDSINLWAPTFLLETHNLDIKETSSFITIIPILGFAGIVFAGWLNRKLHYREKATTSVLFISGVFMIIGFVTLGSKDALMGVIFLGLSSAMMNGANSLLLGIVPMNFARYNKVSAVAGLLDFASYMISGFAATITGFIVDFSGWGGIILFWIIAAIIGTIALVIGQIYDNKTAVAVKNIPSAD